jgi:uncharacterized RDD family membrane protein YckC
VPTAPTPFPTASWGRRILALVVDWLASTLVTIVLVGGAGNWTGNNEANVYVLGVFVLESAIFTALSGGSFGQIATRLRVVRDNGDPRPVGPLQALVRQVLVALVVPPLVFRPDGRGLHDMAAGSATVTLQTFRALSGKGT